MSTPERVRADELEPGDRFGSTRREADAWVLVEILAIGDSARRLSVRPLPGQSGAENRIRPRHSTLFWRFPRADA